MEPADLPAPTPTGDGPSEARPEVVMEAVEEVDEGDIADDVDVQPEAPEPPRRKKRKGLGISFLLNAITLGKQPSLEQMGRFSVAVGLGSWALVKGWKEHIENRSVQFLSGLAVGAWTGLNFMRTYKRNK